MGVLSTTNGRFSWLCSMRTYRSDTCVRRGSSLRHIIMETGVNVGRRERERKKNNPTCSFLFCVTMNKDQYSLALVETAADARECAQLLAEEFAQDNPLSVYNQSTAEDLFENWLYPAIVDVLDQKLCFLIRHRPTNEVVAATIASDLYLYRQKHPYDPSAPASDSHSGDFFDELLDRFVSHDFQQRLRLNQVLYIAVVGTRSSHAGQGLAGQLGVHLCNYARDQRGFECAFVQAAHPATGHIFLKKLKGEISSVVHPETWKWKRMGDGSTCPMQGYQGEPMFNVLVRFDSSK
jgi:hypothetical protein